MTWVSDRSQFDISCPSGEECACGSACWYAQARLLGVREATLSAAERKLQRARQELGILPPTRLECAALPALE
eukprot:6174505-Pleurochrysis_carterae.AAC.7